MRRKGRVDPALPFFAFLVVAVLLVAYVIYKRNVGFASSTVAKEGVLKERLGYFGTRIQGFTNDCGDTPSALWQMVERPPTSYFGGEQFTGGNGRILKFENWNGPYVYESGCEDPMTEKADWIYEPKTGQVHSASEKYCHWKSPLVKLPQQEVEK